MRESFGEKLKKARVKKGFKQSELAKQLGVKNTTISNWENNISKPDLDMLSYICGVLNEKASFFLEAKPPIDEISSSEFEMIEKYRFVSEYSPENADVINAAIDKGYSIAEQISEQKKQLQDQQDQIDMLKQRIVTEIIRRFCLPFYAGLASAGSGEYLFDDIPTDMIEVADTPTARQADFAIGVDGHSMEPDFYDGEKVFVKKTSDLNIGDIGIFLKGENCYIKELGKDRLISHNPDKDNYPDIIADETITVVGKVLGKVGENI